MTELRIQEQGRIKPCMGGWCGRRDACRHYMAPTYIGDSVEPAERLCGPQDGVYMGEPINQPMDSEGK